MDGIQSANDQTRLLNSAGPMDEEPQLPDSDSEIQCHFYALY